MDFSYEVSRSLAACEGAVLIIDAAQGIEAQTLANYHLALEHELAIIPVINKIDLPAADPERVMGEVEELLVMEKSECILASAKNGVGIEEILEAIVQRIPPPKGHRDRLRGLVFNAQFDPYRGVVSYVRVVDGKLSPGDALHVDGARARVRMHRGRDLRAADARHGLAGAGRRGLRDREHQVARRDRRRRHDHVRERSRARRAAGLSQGRADGLLRPLPQRR